MSESIIWSFFDKLTNNNGQHKCKCGKLYNRQKDGNTSTMLRHIREDHAEELLKLQNNGSNIMESFISKGLDKILLFKLTNYMLSAYLPNNFAQNKAFQDLIHYIKPNINIPCE